LGCKLKKFNKYITIHGSRSEIEKAKSVLEGIPNLEMLKESDARLVIQEAIDQHNLTAGILYDGNSVWSMKRILGNLQTIIKNGRLYDKDKPRWIPIESMLRMPTGGKPILSKYFYDFLHLQCGSIAHYDIQGWIAEYPTLEDLKQFFKKNEYGKRVLDYIPAWETDAKRIVEEIERQLFPFETYLKVTRKMTTPEIKTESKTKALHVKITPELLVEVFLESLYFNKDVKKIRFSMTRMDEATATPTAPQAPNVWISGAIMTKGSICGKIVKGVFHGTVTGTEKQIKKWDKLFSDFIAVPEFSLQDYITWLKAKNNENY
jgi:hypothetical protein